MFTKTPLDRISHWRDASDDCTCMMQLAVIAVIAAVRAPPPSPVRAPPPLPVRAPPPSSILLQLPFGEDEELFSAAAWNDAHRCTLARLGYEVRSSPDLRGGIKSTSARVAVSPWIAGLRVVLLYKVHGPFVEVMDVEGASLLQREQVGSWLRISFIVDDEPAGDCSTLACLTFDTVGFLGPPESLACNLPADLVDPPPSPPPRYISRGELFAAGSLTLYPPPPPPHPPLLSTDRAVSLDARGNSVEQQSLPAQPTWTSMPSASATSVPSASTTPTSFTQSEATGLRASTAMPAPKRHSLTLNLAIGALLAIMVLVALGLGLRRVAAAKAEGGATGAMATKLMATLEGSAAGAMVVKLLGTLEARLGLGACSNSVATTRYSDVQRAEDPEEGHGEDGGALLQRPKAAQHEDPHDEVSDEAEGHDEDAEYLEARSRARAYAHELPYDEPAWRTLSDALCTASKSPTDARHDAREYSHRLEELSEGAGAGAGVVAGVYFARGESRGAAAQMDADEARFGAFEAPHLGESRPGSLEMPEVKPIFTEVVPSFHGGGGDDDDGSVC